MPQAAPIAQSRVVQFAGTNLSKEPSRSATIFAAELARQAGVEVVLDMDFRSDHWHDPRAFGVAIRSVLPLVDIVIGTEDEINAAMLADPAHVESTDSVGIQEKRVESLVSQLLINLNGRPQIVLW